LFSSDACAAERQPLGLQVGDDVVDRQAGLLAQMVDEVLAQPA